MDEVLEKFEAAFVTNNNNGNKTNFDGMYKNWGKLGNQEERRKEILNVQKSNRNKKLDAVRGILELVNAVEENEIFSKKKSYYRPSIYVAGFHKTSLSYNNVLMLSEWMIEKPEDFKENWYVTPCPKGVRLLVIANQGITKCFTKCGRFKFENRTGLPGGNPCDSRSRRDCCVLDCFYYQNTNTMYILDLLAWNNQPMTDGETEFRRYWLETQLVEIDDLKVINKKNKIIFSLLPMVSCAPDSFNNFMMTYPAFDGNIPELDGFLFYHKRAHYVAGETPLVGWLFPYMVPEVLGTDITVHQNFLDQKPADYVNQADFITKFEAKYAKRNRSRRTSTNSMDTAIAQTEEEESEDQNDVTKKEAKVETMDEETVVLKPIEEN